MDRRVVITGLAAAVFAVPALAQKLRRPRSPGHPATPHRATAWADR